MYTETVEQIFSSNIETINTLANVLFAENVSNIYRQRKVYKEKICDKFIQEIEKEGGFTEYGQVMAAPFASEYIYLSGVLLGSMKEQFVQCQKMMDVSDADLATYRQKRKAMSQASAADSIQNALLKEASQNYQRLIEAQEKGKKRTENK